MSKEVQQQEYLEITKEEFMIKFPTLSQETVDFYFNQEKILDFGSDFIGVNKYDNLKKKQIVFEQHNYLYPDAPKKELTERELHLISVYESKHTVNLDNNSDYLKEYTRKLHKVPNKKNYALKEGILPNKENLYKLFLKAYKFLNNTDYQITNESLKNLEPIIKYFALDKTFFDAENSIKIVGSRELEPSFDKGLLIIGDVGNGKTSVIKAMHFLIDFHFKLAIKEHWDTAGDWLRLVFKFKTTESLVTEYEFISNSQEKEMFFNKYANGNLFLDDLKREKDASNFGITNVVKSVLEKRYNNQKHYSSDKQKTIKTFGTMNFHDKHPENIDFAIQECGIRYGSHIYDRVFDMFNIVVFKGKSMRK